MDVTGTQLKSLNLHNNRLQAVPDLQVVGQTLFWLKVADNPIIESPEDFIGLYVLETLNAHWTTLSLPNSTYIQATLKQAYLFGNNLQNTDLQNTLLSKYTNLTYLDIESNLLSEFPYAPEIAGSLKTLNMRQNMFSTFPNVSYIFALEVLLLGHSTQMSHIPNGSFTGMNSLYHLEMGSNALVEFPDLTGLEGSLKTLIMNDNKISVLPAGRLANMHALINIDLKQNLLVEVPDLTNVGLTNLKVTYIGALY